MKNIAAGTVFLALAVAFGGSALTLPMGTFARIGPGVFPLILAGLLALLGTAVLATGLKQAPRIPRLQADVRAMVLVLGSVISFGALLVPLGFVPAVALTAGISAIATRENRPLTAVLIAMSIAAFCWLVFLRGLGLSIPSFGTLFRAD